MSELILFSDKKLHSVGLKGSKLFLGGRESPKIVHAILDLSQTDPEWSKFNFTIESLLKQAIDYDPSFKAKLPSSFNQNRVRLENLQDYFLWANLDRTEFTKSEDLLLDLLAKYLKRRIHFTPILKPIYQEQVEKTYGQDFQSSLSIFGYRLHTKSFYISATKLK